MVKCENCEGHGCVDVYGTVVECVPCEGVGYVFGEMDIAFDAEAEHIATFGMNFAEWDEFTA